MVVEFPKTELLFCKKFHLLVSFLGSAAVAAAVRGPADCAPGGCNAARPPRVSAAGLRRIANTH